jgi:hypothetical protein
VRLSKFTLNSFVRTYEKDTEALWKKLQALPAWKIKRLIYESIYLGDARNISGQGVIGDDVAGLEWLLDMNGLSAYGDTDYWIAVDNALIIHARVSATEPDTTVLEDFLESAANDPIVNDNLKKILLRLISLRSVMVR